MKKILLLLFILFSGTLLHAQCDAPTNVQITNLTNNSMDVSWLDPNGTTVEWSIEIFYNGVSAGNFITVSNPYVVTGLACDATIEVAVTSICSPNSSSSPTFATVPVTFTCPFGQPQSLSSCAVNGTACFDLTSNDAVILGNYNPADYAISYHFSSADAQTNTNPIASPYCTSQLQNIYTRIETIANPNEYETNSFIISVLEYQLASSLPPLIACDANNDGIIAYDLTSSQPLLATTNTLSYYTSLVNAQNNLNSIPNPASYSLNGSVLNSTIYVREFIPNTCDSIYPRGLVAQSNCNAASNCSNANSLCNALGTPFINTTGMGSLGANGCLSTTPNPTWFYLPVNQSGNLNLVIKQGNNAPDYNNLDVDYIVYGPFSDASSSCANYGLNNIVSCSYSAAPVEYPVIQNAQVGSYYLLLVTNFSNDNGFISIDLLPTSTGMIDCSGFTFISFLDSNANGIQDTGEVRFPLGTFTYEQNNNGTLHNITAPSGSFNIYDNSGVNSYDVGFDILPNYSAYYNITTAYTSLVPSAGMTTYYFPVTPIQTYDDVAVAIVPVNQPRPGFIYHNKVVFTNLGNQTIPSGTVTFTQPNLTTITTTNPIVTTTGTGFTHNFTNLLPFEIRTIDVYLQVPAVPTVNGGDYLTSDASVDPITNEVYLTNNTSTVTSLVVNGYDPNDKMEAHGPEILYSSFTAEDYLYYTIRFENTGNASAINIRIQDVLHTMLDESTLEMVSASHEYEMDRIGKSITWKFNNIQLPVSQANTSIGKGYVSFKIKPLPGYAVGTIIPNTAAIYFDFNPAIVTNTFTSEFVAMLSNTSFSNASVQIYPNPVSDALTISADFNTIKSVRLYDVLGTTIISTQPSETTFQLDTSALSTGIYLLELTSFTNERLVQKIIKK